MATSSRQSSLFGSNEWQQIYQTFREADFRSYDYETLRKSFIDYLRLYYPETYNDYVESSEFIALLDVIAFMGQGLAFRNDLNARENFIDTAERRDSVIKLAELVSYTPKRNIAGQGFLKVSSVRTSENIKDINGLNLSNVPVLWNDPANPDWLEQFNTVINAALVSSQKVGKPGHVADILGVTTSEYSIRIPENNLPIVPFTSEVDNQNMTFELVSATSVGEDFIYEVPPAPNSRFNILYRNDKLGFGSPETGFFFYFKQGTLQNFDFKLEQQIANQNIDINIEGVNDTDTWLYKLENGDNRTQWEQVENVYADAYLQNETSEKKIFSVSSRFNDQVTYNFGDGVFSEIPVGDFRAYVRASNALTYTIEPTEMQGISVTIGYISKVGRPETLTIGLELPLAVSTAQARETLDSIKQRAPTRYYTQNRMVNGEDYTNFPYTLFSSIIKSAAINRTSVGVSKNLDLQDPTGGYSSTNTYGNDGALYQEMEDGFLSLTINNTSDIISFFNNELAQVLSENKATQYYVQQFPRYTLPETPKVFWKISSVDSSTESGYFYTKSGIVETPVSVGTFSSTTLQYISRGALVKFKAPQGFYFDSNNRLVAGIAGPGKPDFIWTTVLNVVGDGSNNGEGSFANGQGPVRLNGFVPNEVTVDTIIPVFDNVLPASVIDECIVRMELEQDFTLLFDNSLRLDQKRWAIGRIDNPDYFVKFENVGSNRYTVTYRSLSYFFGSVADTRFISPQKEPVYDPFSGKVLQDSIEILSINTAFNSSNPLGRDTTINIVGQNVESDGYTNDYEVEVASTDINNDQLILDPDFFNDITGYVTNGTNTGVYTFFETVQDAINLDREQIVPTQDVVFQYPTKTQIELVKYEFPLGQLFYATTENVFYKTVQDIAVTTPSFILEPQTNYSVKPGRQGLSYQYRHNSNNTTRIDPGTTNIIDLYIVDQAYYNSYVNWISDTTDTLTEPNRPTVSELNQKYGDIQNFKMISDSVILNSALFKPLFGRKADPALQGTVKVVKSKNTNASNSEVRSAVLSSMNDYFDINNWNFGDTFFFSELSAYLHRELGDFISSVVLVPNDPSLSFGDLYEIKCKPFEIFVNAATADDIIIVPALTSEELQIAKDK